MSEAGYVTYQAKVEAALVRTLANYGICTSAMADEVEQAIDLVTAEEVYEEQSRIRHNIRSLVNVIRRKISPEARPYVHLFATSADILDTATALRFKALTENVIVPDLIALVQQLIGISTRACRDSTKSVGHTVNTRNRQRLGIHWHFISVVSARVLRRFMRQHKTCGVNFRGGRGV